MNNKSKILRYFLINSAVLTVISSSVVFGMNSDKNPNASGHLQKKDSKQTNTNSNVIQKNMKKFRKNYKIKKKKIL
jgi:hypothetical protein